MKASELQQLVSFLTKEHDRLIADAGILELEQMKFKNDINANDRIKKSNVVERAENDRIKKSNAVERAENDRIKKSNAVHYCDSATFYLLTQRLVDNEQHHEPLMAT